LIFEKPTTSLGKPRFSITHQGKPWFLNEKIAFSLKNKIFHWENQGFRLKSKYFLGKTKKTSKKTV